MEIINEYNDKLDNIRFARKLIERATLITLDLQADRYVSELGKHNAKDKIKDYINTAIGLLEMVK